jgi:proteasome lid subunit RPN8/RPN11
VSFSSDLIRRWSPLEERCGLITASGEIVDIVNYAVEIGLGSAEFAMLNSDVEQALGGRSLHGIFHTHPSNSPKPSALDVAGWPAGNLAYYVVTQTTVTEWKLVGSKPALIARAESKVDRRVLQATAQSGPAS